MICKSQLGGVSGAVRLAGFNPSECFLIIRVTRHLDPFLPERLKNFHSKEQLRKKQASSFPKWLTPYGSPILQIAVKF